MGGGGVSGPRKTKDLEKAKANFRRKWPFDEKAACDIFELQGRVLISCRNQHNLASARLTGQDMNGSKIAAAAVPVGSESDSADQLTSLFDAHYDRLYRLARRLTYNADDALDLVQETFLKAAKSLRSIPSGAKDEEAWLVRVLVNIQRDHWRKIAVRERHNKSEFGHERPASGKQNAEAALIARATVWRALDSLPPRRRAIVVMHELEELDAKTIARLLGISAITVRWHLSLGKSELARALK